MDLMTEILTALQIAESAYASAARMLAEAKAQGDPTTADVTAQMAASKAANDRFHALVPAGGG